MSELSRERTLRLLSSMRAAFKAQEAEAATKVDAVAAVAAEAVCRTLMASVQLGSLDVDESPHPEPPC